MVRLTLRDLARFLDVLRGGHGIRDLEGFSCVGNLEGFGRNVVASPVASQSRAGASRPCDATRPARPRTRS